MSEEKIWFIQKKNNGFFWKFFHGIAREEKVWEIFKRDFELNHKTKKEIQRQDFLIKKISKDQKQLILSSRQNN
ncbi:hypothetical protein CL633_02335 [bacterium]|nr:hypothetical protein [bacterium]|tara:strand:- start:1743 stop:1964 length:222 start_codon:yes stop_codon:yes gene_type:complete